MILNNINIFLWFLLNRIQELDPITVNFKFGLLSFQEFRLEILFL